MAARVQLLPVADFTGGLNLRDDWFQIRGNETPDCLNVDLLPQGGLQRRDAVDNINSTAVQDSAAASKTPDGLWPLHLSTGTSYVVTRAGNDIAYSTGGNFTAVATSRTVTFYRAAQFSDALYFVAGKTKQPFKWNGTIKTDLTDVGFNDDLEAPNDGNFVYGETLAVWHSYMWVANVRYSGTDYVNRLHFSHPGRPEDFRTLDYLSIGDKSPITGLAAFGDSLLVFKRNAVYALTGYGPESFQVIPVSTRLGVAAQEQIAVSEELVAFFDPMLGVHVWDGKKMRNVFETLQPALADNTIVGTYIDSIVCEWMDDRLFVSVPWEAGSAANTSTLVWDPRASDTCWYRYSYGSGGFCDFARQGNRDLHLSCRADGAYVLDIKSSNAQDDFGGGNTNIESYYETAWFDAGLAGVTKRWRRPMFVCDAAQTYDLAVIGSKDYNPSAGQRSFSLGITAASDGLTFDVDNWDEANWAASSTYAQTIEKGSALGRAYAVSLRLQGPPASRWGVNAIQFKYIVQRIR